MICLLVFAICWLCSIHLKTRHPELHRFWFLKSHKSTFLISGFVLNEKFQQKIHKIYYTFYRYKIPKWLFLIFDFCATLCFPWKWFHEKFRENDLTKIFLSSPKLEIGRNDLFIVVLIDWWQQLTTAFTMFYSSCNRNFSWREQKKLAKRYLATINYGFEMKTTRSNYYFARTTDTIRERNSILFKKGKNMLKSNSDVSGSTSLVCNAVFFCFSWNRKRILWWPKRV